MLTHPSARYSDLKPTGVEANLFVYHLKQLVSAGLIEKQDGRYLLTRRGKHYADRATLDNMRIRVQPKLLTILAIRRADGMWLILRRRHQPFVGYRGFPSGKVHYGERLEEAAERELFEKSGLRDVPLALRGNVVIRFVDGDETVNHVSGYVFYGEVPVGTEPDTDQELYESYFGAESDFFVEPCFKGHQQILEYIRRGAGVPFIEECQFASDY